MVRHRNENKESSMKSSLVFAIIFSFACAAETSSAPPTLRHYEFRADQLPPPFATSSANNSPRVTAPPADARLVLPPGFKISVFAENLDDPRRMLLAANGDVVLSEPGAGKITILRDANHDGVAEQRFTFATNLNAPYGLAFHDGFLYVGNEDAVVRIPYAPGATHALRPPQQIAPLPSGGHSTRGVIFNRTGTKMYVSVGSASNVNSGEPPERAAIVEFNPDGSGKRIFASGLRNPIGMAWEPVTGALWTAVNERDGLGDDLVPDYVTEVRDGGFYGWPYSYIGKHEDPRRASDQRRDLVARAIVPSVLIQSHSAALGIVFYDGSMFPKEYRGSAFVALHGSWNRSRRTGYKIIRVPFGNGHPTGGYDDFVNGWMLDEQSRSVWGRPVDLLVLGDGSLLISDDGAEKIWRVTYGSAP
jgi:glucose/arabinose dehydrogenase